MTDAYIYGAWACAGAFRLDEVYVTKTPEHNLYDSGTLEYDDYIRGWQDRYNGVIDVEGK